MQSLESVEENTDSPEGWKSWLYGSAGRFVHDGIYGPLLYFGRRAVIASLPEKKPLSVLEIGVGSGLSLKKYPEGVEVTGIDPSLEMLKLAEKRAKKAKADVMLHQMWGEHLEFPDSSFDVVVTMNVLSVVSDARKVLQESHRVLTPEGKIITVNASHTYNPLKLLSFVYTREQLKSILGFDIFFRLEDVMDSHWRVAKNTRRLTGRLLALEKSAA